MGIPRSAIKELEEMEGMEDVEWEKLCGRNGIKMGWAKKKLREGEEPEVKEKVVKPVREKKVVVEAPVEEGKERREWIDYDAEGAPPRPVGTFDRTASRTVIIQGIPAPLTEADILAKKEAKEKAMEVDTEGEQGETKEEEVAGEEDGKPIDWKKVLKQKVRKTGEIEEVSWPVVLSSGETVGKFNRISNLSRPRFQVNPYFSSRSQQLSFVYHPELLTS